MPHLQQGGGDDWQMQRLADVPGQPRSSSTWPTWHRRSGTRTASWVLVVGATTPEELARVRAIAPDLPLLVPGVGAQGGDAAATVKAAGTAAPLMVNSSRAILYADNGPASPPPQGGWRKPRATPCGLTPTRHDHPGRPHLHT